MRRLAIGLLVAGAGLGLAGGVRAADDGDGAGERTPAVHVLQVSGLFDPIVVRSVTDAIDGAEQAGAVALILQVNSRGAVVSDDEMADLLGRIDSATVPIAVWVGPSGARLYGPPAQLLAVADVSGMAPGARVGYTGLPLEPEGVTVDFGAATAPLRAGSMGLREARELGVFDQRVPDEGIPTIKNMVHALDGYREGGVTLRTTEERVLDDGTVQREPVVTVIMSKLSLVDQVFHAVASPSMAYLLFLVGLALLVFEFFTAGVGIAGVVGAGALILAATGLATLPARGWAVGVLIAAMLAFAVDVQVGVPRFWTGVGVVLTIVGSVWLFEPLPGTTLRPSWITLLAGVGGLIVTFVTGMPSMVRTRFATPTIGREWMIGEQGEAVEAIDPDGVVAVGAGQWRARTNRATPVAAGQPVRVVAIDGVTLEVEPLESTRRPRSGHS